MSTLSTPVERPGPSTKRGLERGREVSQESQEVRPTQTERGKAETVSEPAAHVVVSTPQQTTVYAVKSETLKKIERILEEHIDEIYVTLTPAQQEVVKREGEFTAQKIEELINTAKATAIKIFHLILRWLEFIPGVNRWFAEQEAKIKTDKIMKLQKSKSSI